MNSIRYVHTNLVARDWRRLARFYVDTFRCRPRPPERDLRGEWLDRLTGLERAHISGIHLSLPGYGRGGPTLEVFQYSPARTGAVPTVNLPGYGHIAFSVRDVQETLRRVAENGGSSVGEAICAEIEGVGTINVVYARDPEGNVVEIQKWD